MAYVRRKKVGGYSYYQIVENRRVEGAPRQKVLLHLGGYSSVAEALREWPEDIEIARRAAEEARENHETYAPIRSGRSHLKEEARHLRRARKLQEKLDLLRELVERGVVERTARVKEEKHGEEEG